MTMKKACILLWSLLILFSLPGCYEDLGNYDYHQINELSVDSILKTYARDVDDSLIITPVLKGNLYSDSTRFTYSWEIDGKKVGESHDLRIQIDQLPGYKYSRYIVTDKETNVRKYYEFAINISSSTAGDLIMVLSKYQGRAELSYLRLDKPANWAVNYFAERYGRTLGTDPQQLTICYLESAKSAPFVNSFGRVMVLADNQINLIDKSTLMPDTLNPVLTQDAYTGLATYPKPDIEKYEPEFIQECINIWRYVTYGAQKWCYNMQISAGRLFTASMASAVWSSNYSYNKQSPYKNGYLAPFGYWDNMSDTPNDNNIQTGYQPGSFIVFDQNNYRFAYADAYGSIREIKEEDIKSFPNHNLLWGAATNRANNTSIAALNNGDQCRLILLQDGKTSDGKQDTKKLAGEIGTGNTLNAKSRFYMMKYTDYLLFSSGNKLYRYNTLNINSGIAPGEGDKVFNLSQFGYDDQAVITDICVSRTEKTLLVGVSRYGTDTEASGEEAKGDVLHFDLNPSTMAITYNEAKSHKGVAGIPVNVTIKYQTHWRNGLGTDGTLKDNI